MSTGRQKESAAEPPVESADPSNNALSQDGDMILSNGQTSARSLIYNYTRPDRSTEDANEESQETHSRRIETAPPPSSSATTTDQHGNKLQSPFLDLHVSAPTAFPDPLEPSQPNSPLNNNRSAPPMQTWRHKLHHSWLMSKGMVLVMLAQFFGASMNVMTRTLQLDGNHGKGMHPFQILFVRMGSTVLLSALYMAYTRVPHPLGQRPVRPLLLLRGISGFFGVFGLYHSLLYLALSEATVLTFLAPIGSCYLCSLIMPNETFTRRQQMAALASLSGVVLIAKPSLLVHGFSAVVGGSADADADAATDTERYKRTLGMLSALLGVLGATVAYSSIRIIGKRAHPLVSVTYFSAITTVVSLLGVLLIPSVTFRFPENVTEWLLLVGLGTCGFILQFLLTAGLSYVPPSVTGAEKGVNPVVVVGEEAVGVVDVDGDAEREGLLEEGGQRGQALVQVEEGDGGKQVTAKPSTHGSKATSMVYTQMLFAVLYDKIVFNATPSLVSWAGSGIIVASAMYVASAKEKRQGSGGGGDDGGEDGACDGVQRRRARHMRVWSVEDARLAEAEEGRELLEDYDGGEGGEGGEGNRSRRSGLNLNGWD
ncbi:hypothetical protein PAAG_00374 [Paracoccidioides lutzii Pb01]|uniref:EamA domain-containing protein n=1 Tax=Paracoccidioides lutzii (strain ATCC MYA-826 / Pb01) TaxID=502779 RepID=C1GPC9_PARBA|nr:hypothetical protein PAAG_00374 [Paracoccidioides lutzii Pb01]EEH36051.1 hypothetical protein PAAG_00374 [Paracoccidioides lutzii Pb01]